jgi:hypothetical protein
MKTKQLRLLLALGISSLLLNTTQAQLTTGVPNFISYQGRVLDNSGTVVGLGTPVNRKVTFRIWDHPSASTEPHLVYSEEQTVTILNGDFSVLVGQGVIASSAPFGFSETLKGPGTISIDNAFNGTMRYLGVTVDDGNGGTVDNEISPRQQVVSSAFAFRAKYAETLGTSASTALTAIDSGNVGIGTADPTGRLQVVDTHLDIFTSTGTAGGFAKDGLTVSSNPGAGFSSMVVNSDHASSGDRGIFDVKRGGQSQFYVRGDGNVGIGTTSPAYKLQVAGSLGSSTLTTGTADLGASKFKGVGRNTGLGGAYLEWGNQSPGTYGQTYLLNQKEGGNEGIFLGEVNTSHGISTSLFTTPGRTWIPGQLGIGTTTPGITKLAVVATANQEAARFSRAGLTYSNHFHNGPNGDNYLRSGSGAGKVILQDTGGQVTIGSGTPPATKLYVYSPNSSLDTAIFNRGGGPSSHIHNGPNGDIYWRSNSDAGKVILQDYGGNVAIGTQDASLAKLSVFDGPWRDGIYGAYINGAVAWNATTHGAHTISIYANQTIWAGNTVIASSDKRIKEIEGKSDGSKDLQTLLGIDITDYRYKDQIMQDDTPQKKVIAQQLETVFPQAVSRQTNVVPDIYEKATILEDGWIELATDLKKGERVRLIATEKQEIFEVLEVEEKRFRTEFKPEEEESLFVYGREVNDFRTVDYDAIAMLNVSATQEIKKEKDAEIAALKAENAALRKQLADQAVRTTSIEEDNKIRDAKMAAIERLLNRKVQPVSITAK